MYIHIHIIIYAYTYICIYVIHMPLTSLLSLYTNIYICIHVYTYIYKGYIYIYVYVFMYVYIFPSPPSYHNILYTNRITNFNTFILLFVVIFITNSVLCCWIYWWHNSADMHYTNRIMIVSIFILTYVVIILTNSVLYLWLYSWPKIACMLCTNSKMNRALSFFCLCSYLLHSILCLWLSCRFLITFISKQKKICISTFTVWFVVIFITHVNVCDYIHFVFVTIHWTINSILQRANMRENACLCAQERVCLFVCVCARMRVCAMVCWCDPQNTATHCNTPQHHISTLQRVRIFGGVSCHPFTSVTLLMDQATPFFQVRHDSWMTRFGVWHDSCKSETFSRSSSVVCAQESWHAQEWVMSNVWRDTF